MKILIYLAGNDLKSKRKIWTTNSSWLLGDGKGSGLI